MKLNKIALIGTFAVAALSSQAFVAQDATVNFNARLVAATCDISASKSLVNLGTHSIEKITDINKALAESNFNLVLNNTK
ncbi:fimbrial protein [Providencia manganoxydans]|uniref:fimbrial protein n=1 Tax=Providencia manganoxydans TaxID=2923283 RepID=UPI002810692D|nr:type 1 fimbrial protein [Providencia stuartii]ELR5082333.1 type 1 fimbrial protein [Providencia stuartii]